MPHDRRWSERHRARATDCKDERAIAGRSAFRNDQTVQRVAGCHLKRDPGRGQAGGRKRGRPRENNRSRGRVQQQLADERHTRQRSAGGGGPQRCPVGEGHRAIDDISAKEVPGTGRRAQCDRVPGVRDCPSHTHGRSGGGHRSDARRRVQRAVKLQNATRAVERSRVGPVRRIDDQRACTHLQCAVVGERVVRNRQGKSHGLSADQSVVHECRGRAVGDIERPTRSCRKAHRRGSCKCHSARTAHRKLNRACPGGRSFSRHQRIKHESGSHLKQNIRRGQSGSGEVSRAGEKHRC